ncbi:hypothetical protein Ae201684P_012276 [Aphanomyces euteiches]|nr:hypothetical protein Ae201684P_012276 [Aphanomyces euteiches]
MQNDGVASCHTAPNKEPSFDQSFQSRMYLVGRIDLRPISCKLLDHLDMSIACCMMQWNNAYLDQIHSRAMLFYALPCLEYELTNHASSILGQYSSVLSMKQDEAPHPKPTSSVDAGSMSHQFHDNIQLPMVSSFV